MVSTARSAVDGFQIPMANSPTKTLEKRYVDTATYTVFLEKKFLIYFVSNETPRVVHYALVVQQIVPS